jgi:hypothetical protein
MAFVLLAMEELKDRNSVGSIIGVLSPPPPAPMNFSLSDSCSELCICIFNYQIDISTWIVLLAH